MSKDRDDLARYLLQQTADDAPPYEVAIDYGKPASQMQARIERLEAALAEIVAFTEWAKDTDLSGDDWLTELRHPEQVTAKCVWDMAQKAGKL